MKSIGEVFFVEFIIRFLQNNLGANDYKVYEFCGEFMGSAAQFKVVNTFGHIMKLEFVDEYLNWYNYKPLELFSCPLQKLECNPNAKISKVRIFKLNLF